MDVDINIEGVILVMMYDTGSRISVIPEELVADEYLTGESKVRGYDGISKLRKLAEVNSKIGDCVFSKHKVALVSCEEMSGKGLLATKPGEKTC